MHLIYCIWKLDVEDEYYVGIMDVQKLVQKLTELEEYAELLFNKYLHNPIMAFLEIT